MADIKAKIKVKAYVKMVGLNDNILDQLNARPRNVAKGYTFFSGNNTIEEGNMPTIEGREVTPGKYQNVIPGENYLNGDIVILPVPSEEKTVTPSESEQVITPEAGKYIKQVTVGAILTEQKEVTPSESEQVITPEAGKYIKQVTVGAIQTEAKEITAGTNDVVENATEGKYIKQVTVKPTPSEEKTVTPSEEVQEILPSEGKLLAKVNVNAIQTDNKEVTPSESEQVITPEAGKYIKQVTVGAIQVENAEVTPSEEVQTITPEDGKYLKKVIVEAIPGDYVGSEVPRQEAVTIVPGQLNKSISANKYLEGNVKVLGDVNLNAKNIKEGVTLYEGTDGEIVGTHADGNVILIQLIEGTLEHLNIPEGTTIIRQYGFEYGSFKTLTIPNTVKQIDYRAFGFSKLQNITIPNTITTLGQYIFSNCDELETVIFENGCLKVGRSMFRYCQKLTTATIPNTVITIEMSAFENCSKLASVTVPNATLGEYVFLNCTSLKNVVLVNGFNQNLDMKESTAFEAQDLSFMIGRYADASGKTLTIGSTNLAKLTDIYVQSYDDYLADGGIQLYDFTGNEYLNTDLVVCESTEANANLVTTIATAKGLTLA